VQVTNQLTPEDFYHGFQAWRNQRKLQKWTRLTAYFIVTAGSLLCLAMLFLEAHVATTPTALSGVAFGVVWFAWMLFAPRFFSQRQFRNHPTAQSATTLNISDAGLEIHSAHTDSKVAWSAYVGWAESKSAFVIMPQPRIYIPIPKRAFSEEQLGEFRECCGGISARSNADESR
jgi:hypothetical protein